MSTPKMTPKEKAAIIETMKTFDTNRNDRLDKAELPAFIKDVVSTASGNPSHCMNFMRFGFDDVQKSSTATSADVTEEVAKRAAQKANELVAKSTKDDLNSELGKKAFPKGIEAYPIPGDFAPIGKMVVNELKKCAAVPLNSR